MVSLVEEFHHKNNIQTYNINPFSTNISAFLSGRMRAYPIWEIRKGDTLP